MSVPSRFEGLELIDQLPAMWKGRLVMPRGNEPNFTLETEREWNECDPVSLNWLVDSEGAVFYRGVPTGETVPSEVLAAANALRDPNYRDNDEDPGLTGEFSVKEFPNDGC